MAGSRRVLTGAAAIVASLAFAQPAAAIHLFPLTPVLDPLGHDCAQALDAAPEEPGATVLVAGFGFIDRSRLVEDLRLSSTTTVAVGEPVTWRWLLDHCHSVTFSPELGTAGEEGFQPPQPELVRKSAEGDSFTLSFDEPGTYSYVCVHHESVGMRGEVVVTPD